ncbi:MAG TPA: YciI family protein [Microlunatus sp.]
MTRYMILICGDEKQWEAMSAEERRRLDQAHQDFGTRAGSAILAAGELEPTSTATTLKRGSDATPTITDGPFLESKEVVGGFYLIEADNLDEVIKLTSGLYEVSAEHSGVEIRPLVDHG